MNAISPEFLREYGQLFDSLSRDGYDVRALVLSSAIPKVFTAGIDCMYSPFFPIGLKNMIMQLRTLLTVAGEKGMISPERHSGRARFSTSFTISSGLPREHPFQ